MELCFSHASGTSIIIISGKDLPEINKSSTTISMDAESDFPGKMIGKTLFRSSLLIKGELNSSSRAFILLILPFNVLISPL